MKKIILISILILIMFPMIVFATGKAVLTANKTEVKEGEEFEISVNLEDVPTVAFQIELQFNSENIEYISGPENSNKIDNKIIYIWVDETGGETPKRNETIAIFKFKAIKTGEATFTITGEFFDKNKKTISPTTNPMSIIINPVGTGKGQARRPAPTGVAE